MHSERTRGKIGNECNFRRADDFYFYSALYARSNKNNNNVLYSYNFVRIFSKAQNKKLMCSLNYSLFSCPSFLCSTIFDGTKHNKKRFKRLFHICNMINCFVLMRTLLFWTFERYFSKYFLCAENVINFSYWHHWFILRKKRVMVGRNEGLGKYATSRIFSIPSQYEEWRVFWIRLNTKN